MDREVKARLRWVQLFLATGSAELVCRRCGVSRPTLRKWVERYRADGLAGLASKSRRPENSPGRKVFEREVAWILELRKRSLEARGRGVECAAGLAAARQRRPGRGGVDERGDVVRGGHAADPHAGFGRVRGRRMAGAAAGHPAAGRRVRGTKERFLLLCVDRAKWPGASIPS